MSKYAAFNQGKRFADTKARAGAAQSKYIGFVVLICELIKSPGFATKRFGGPNIIHQRIPTANTTHRTRRSYFTRRRNSPIHNTGGAAKKKTRVAATPIMICGRSPDQRAGELESEDDKPRGP
jgi:hypothetical protein